MNIQTVGIIGYGNFGAFAHVLIKRFAPQMSVRIYSKDKKSDGTTFFSLQEVAASDAVIVAVPISLYESVLKKLVLLMRPESVIVDVATVKMHTVKLLRRHAKGRRYIATHPMFGPESYAKKGNSVEGLRIVVTEHTLAQQEYAAFASLISSLGFNVIEMTATKHDKHLAETLFLTHFIGQTITKAGFDRTEIDTVSFGFLMDAVESVRVDKRLFEEVFRYNPYCKKVVKRLKDAQDVLMHSLTG